MILELIEQPYFDLKRNNSNNVWNKCLIVLESIHWAQIWEIKPHICRCNIAFMWSFTLEGYNTCILGILEKISPSELVSNGYISNHNKMRRQRPKFKVSFYSYFCCFWINVIQINFENIKRKIQRIISDTSCLQLKSWFNVDARAPSSPLLNFPFNAWIFWKDDWMSWAEDAVFAFKNFKGSVKELTWICCGGER